MALDDPAPGSSWNGGHWYGEKIPTVRGKKVVGRSYNPLDDGMRGQPRDVRRFNLNILENGQTKMNSKARKKAIAMWQNRQDI